MKRPFNILILIVFFYSCGNNRQEDKKPIDTPAKHTPIAKSDSGISRQDSIMATGKEVLTFLKTQNFKELVKYFSEDGVLFSPHGFIDTIRSKKLTPDDFLNAINKNWILTWGNADGTGDPIKLTVKSYLNKFGYNADYLNAEAVGFDEIIKKGNSTINLQEIYPNHHFIEYHFSGFEQKYKGMDWTSLRLVFEKQDDQYFLVALVHDQWTI